MKQRQLEQELAALSQRQLKEHQEEALLRRNKWRASKVSPASRKFIRSLYSKDNLFAESDSLTL